MVIVNFVIFDLLLAALRYLRDWTRQLDTIKHYENCAEAFSFTLQSQRSSNEEYLIMVLVINGAVRSRTDGNQWPSIVCRLCQLMSKLRRW